jgi:type I restriction enzyme S subunit
MGNGSTFNELSSDSLSALSVVFPSMAMQRMIADHLDEETSRIDLIIRAKLRMIHVLRERHAVRVATVTRAGIVAEALQQVLPPSWRIVLLKRCFASIDYGTGEATSSEGAIPVLGMGNLDRGRIVNPPSGFIDAIDPHLILKHDDLLFNRTNSLALVGKVARFDSADRPTSFASYLVRLRTSSVANATYLNYLLNTDDLLTLARSLALPSIGQANLNPNRYSGIRIPLPPVDEQRRIARMLAEEEAETDRLVEVLQRQVNVFEERRRALVTAAVTGRLSIPGVAA